MKKKYTPPVATTEEFYFETNISANACEGDFPGLGWGVDGTPAHHEGHFPGHGHGWGWKDKDAGH